MSKALVRKVERNLGRGQEALVPAAVAGSGPHATKRFIEFFTANIRNKNTRRAYLRAVTDFFNWLEKRGVGDVSIVQPVHVAAYVEQLGKTHAAPSVKQHLAAVRMLFDWFILGQVVAVNPASAVRGPSFSAKKGKTPVLSSEEARDLLDSIPITRIVKLKDDTETVEATLVGLRDRALIGLMIYTFARVGAAISMRVEDYYVQGRRFWVRLHEKGSKRHEMPCHHNLDAYLSAYIDAAGIGSDRKGPLFRTAVGKTEVLTAKPMAQADVYRMIKRRAENAGIETEICCHSFRATGITTYLQNGGKLEVAQQMAAHESARTTGLYDRRDDAVSLDEVERIVI
jgi:site-specific recombinase XerD